jgi:hypothetical protein
MNIIIAQIIILFVVIYLYFSSSKTGDSKDWLRAIVLAIAIPLLSLLPAYIGSLGWIIAIVVTLALISKLTGQSVTDSLLFLTIIGIVQYVIQTGISRFVK